MRTSGSQAADHGMNKASIAHSTYGQGKNKQTQAQLRRDGGKGCHIFNAQA